MQRALNTDRYFDTLPPKRIRDAQRLSKWADEAINVFFKEGKHGVNHQGRQRKVQV